MALYSAQRTIFGISLQLAMLSGKEYKIKPNSLVTDWITQQSKGNVKEQDTENKDEVQDEIVLRGNYPTLRYLMFGEGGIGSVNGSQGNYPYTQHSAIDGRPFKPVRIDDLKTTPNLPITPASYLLMLEDDQIVYDGTFYQVNKSKDVHTVDVYGEESKFMNPTPIDKNNLIIADNSSFILCNLRVKLNLEIDLLENLRNNSQSGKITEISICTGLPNYQFVQVAYHIDMTIDLEAALNTGTRIDRVIEVGGQCPLLK